MSPERISRSGVLQSADRSFRWLESHRFLWILGVIALALLLTTNLPWQLDDYDQAKQAYSSFEIVKEGHWLYQHTPHERIATKPPLIGWISAALYGVTRSWVVAWRLPSLAAALALAILLFRAGAAYGPTGSWIASSAFVFNLLTPRLATLVRTDTPLALAISATGILIWNKIRTREEWKSRDQWILFGLLTAAMLIKGPIVYAFLLPGLIGLQIWRCSHGAMSPCEGVDNAIAAPRPSEAARTAWWPWIASLAIFLLWVIGGSTFVPGFYEQVVVREFLGRFGETIHRPQPLLFYCPHLLHKFFPWSALLVVLGIVNFSLRKLDGLNPSSLKARFWARISPETWWLICWSVGGLIVMSIIPSKRVDRIFPVIPPLCLLLAAQLNGLMPNERLQSGVIKSTMVALVVSILFASGYSGFKVFTGYRDHRNALVLFGRAVRAQAAARQWRYEVVKSNDEGLLLYLETLHFIDSDSATSEWNRGELDALVVSEKNAPDLLRQLHDAALADLKSSPRPDQTDNYVLIVR